MDFYLQYLEKAPDMSPEQHQKVLEWLSTVLYKEFGYIRPIRTVEAGFRIWLGWVDKVFFNEYYLGLSKAAHQERWMENWDKSRFLQLAARGHGKSEIYSHALPTREICYTDGIRILLVSKTSDLGEKYLYLVKDEFETNPRIIADFGDLRRGVQEHSILRGHARKWQSKMFYVVRYGERTAKDPTMEAIGMGGAITGGRFDIIIVEDPIEEKDCRNRKSRDRHEDWLSGVIEQLLEPAGRVFLIGTRKNRDDLYSRSIKNPVWYYQIDKGILRYPNQYEYIYDEVEGKKIAVDVKMSDKGEVLWDDPSNSHSWSMKKLLLKKAGTPSYVFAREIQNEMTDEESNMFPMAVIEKNYDVNKDCSYKLIQEHDSKEFLAKICGCDFSAIFDKQHAIEKDTNYNVFIVLGIHRVTYDRQLLYMFRERGLNPDAQIDKLVWIADHLNPDLFIVEANVFQRVYSYILKKKKLKVVPHVTGGEKWNMIDGLPGMAMDFNNAEYIIPRGDSPTRLATDVLISELNGLGVEEFDDTVMSLWLASLGCKIYEKWDRKKQDKKRSEITTKIQSFG